MRQEVLEAALRALVFAQAWVDGWRPGQTCKAGGVALLALQSVRDPGWDEGTAPLPPDSFIPAVYTAPAWLASMAGMRVRILPEALPEPQRATLMLLGMVAQYREPGRLGLGRFLRRKLKRRHDPLLVAYAAMLHAVEALPVERAARELARPELRARYGWLARYEVSLCRRELVLAMHAAQAGGFLLPGALPAVGELGEPWQPICVGLTALFCAAQSPASATPSTWIDELHPDSAALLDATVYGGRRGR